MGWLASYLGPRPSPVLPPIFGARNNSSILTQAAKVEALHHPRHDDEGPLVSDKVTNMYTQGCYFTQSVANVAKQTS